MSDLSLPTSFFQDAKNLSLFDLADRANSAHNAALAEADLASTHINSALQRAMESGAYLSAAKDRVQHGEWGDWLDQNFEGTRRYARHYMQLFRERDAIESQANRKRVSDLSIRRALELVREKNNDAPEQPSLGGETSNPSSDQDPTPGFIGEDDGYGEERRDALSGLAEGGGSDQPPPQKQPTDDPAVFSHASDLWFTPEPVIKAARSVLGGIDLDPASAEEANETVGADTYYTKADGGLSQEWFGRVWLNPPYGLDADNNSNQDKWTSAIRGAYERGEIDAGLCLVTFSPDRSWFEPLWNYPMCAFRKRLRFETPDGDVPNSPVDANVVIYFGDDTARFKEEFSQFGAILVPDGTHVRVFHGQLRETA